MMTALRYPILLLALLACCGQVRAELIVTLRPVAAVAEGEYVRLRDVAELRGESADCRRAGAIFLGRAPKVGESRTLSRWQIERRLQAYGFAGQSLSLDGGSTVRLAASELKEKASPSLLKPESPELDDAVGAVKKVVDQPKLAMSTELLSSVIVAEVQKEIRRRTVARGARIAVEMVKLDECSASNVARVRLECLPAEPRSGKIKLDVQLLDAAGRSLGRTRALVQVRMTLPAVVARIDLPRGALLMEDAIDLVYVPEQQAARALVNLKALVGQRTRSALRAGGIIRQGMVEVPPLVARNQVCPIRLKVGAFQVNSRAQALESGVINQTIRVRNLQSGQVYYARITGAGELQPVLN